MNIAAGKITAAARAAIEANGGRIETTLKANVFLAVIPGGVDINAAGNCHWIPLEGEDCLVFERRWHTEDCSLCLDGE